MWLSDLSLQPFFEIILILLFGWYELHVNDNCTLYLSNISVLKKEFIAYNASDIITSSK